MIKPQHTSKLNLNSHIEFFNQPHLKQLGYKKLTKLNASPDRDTKSRKQTCESISLGLVIPFQPCMWNEKTTNTIWNNAMKKVQAEMFGKYSTHFNEKILLRLKKIFEKLNFNTLRKSLAILISPDEEKIIYLNSPVKLAVVFGENVSILDLASNIQHEADFYCMTLQSSSITIYDYNNRHLSRLYEHSNEKKPATIIKNASSVIQLLHDKYEKPMIINGNPNLVDQFINSPHLPENFLPLCYDSTLFTNKHIHSIAKDISDQWNYWRSKFFAAKLLLSQKTNGLITHIETVLNAIRKGANGLLLIDKQLKQQIQQSVAGGRISLIPNDTIKELAKFLSRGNLFEITEPGLLSDHGGIVLLRNPSLSQSSKEMYKTPTDKAGRDEIF